MKESGLKWGLIWLGFFGGIALMILAAAQPDKEKIACFNSGGVWTAKVIGRGLDRIVYYTCAIPELKEESK